MTENEIISSINSWNQLALTKDSKSAQEIVTLFEDSGDSFTYALDKYSEVSELLHLYPGIYKGKLYVFVIPAEYDKAKYSGSFNKYVVPCEVCYNLQSNQIPESVAKERMDRWKHQYKNWIPQQVVSPVGIFQVFTLDPGDFELKKSIINMGLLSHKSENLDRADLIVTNIDGDQVIYDDAAGVVPPYGPSAAATSFYLLNS